MRSIASRRPHCRKMGEPLRMGRLSARLPDALVGITPDAGSAFGLRLNDRPEAPQQALVSAGVEQDRVGNGSEDIILSLTKGCATDHLRERKRTMILNTPAKPRYSRTENW
jgi:hypothetical protein